MTTASSSSSTPRPWAMALVALAALATVVALAALAAAQTDPPGADQDWIISKDSTVVTGTNIHLDGSLFVNDSSRLTLRNLTLTMDVPSDGATSIFIEAGSYLTINNVVIKSTSAANHYWFEIRGVGNITNSDVSGVASNFVNHGSWDQIVGGVQIYDTNTTLTNSRFHDSQRIEAYVGGANPRITGCDFYNTEYVYTDKLYEWYYIDYNNYGYFSFLFTDATGLYLSGSSPVIEKCNFRDNGIPASAVGYYSTESDPNYLETWGRGILAYDSSPSIGNCTFTDNGEQPGDQVVNGITVLYMDGLIQYYEFPVEGGLACVGTSAPSVNWSSFTSNDLFGIMGDGGCPALINHTSLVANHYIRGNNVYAPSAGIYVTGAGGNIRIENTVASANLVLTSIYVSGPSAIISNFTNTDNAVNGYDIDLGAGNHLITNCTLNGDRSGASPMQAVIFIESGNGIPKLRVVDCRIIGGSYSLYTSWNGVQAVFVNSSLSGADTGLFYLYSSNVDCIDCPTVQPERIDGYEWGGGSTVRIMYHALFQVKWQSNEPVTSAFLQVKNATQDFLFGGITNASGILGPVVLTAKTWLLTGGRMSTFLNSPIYGQAFSSGLQSVQYKFDLTLRKVTDPPYAIIIYDTKDPEIYVFSPIDGYAQNSTNLTFFGMCLDIGSGIRTVEYSFDGGTFVPTSGLESWNGWAILKEGKHQLVIRTEDKAGNKVLKVVKNIVIDLTPPQLEVLDPVKPVWYSNADNYTIKGRTFEQSRLYVNGQPVDVAPDGSWAFTQDLHSGNNEFTIRSIDRVGNVNEVVKTIVRDSTIPKLILTSPEDGMFTNISQVEVKGITEVGAIIEIDGEPIPTYGGRFASTVFLTEGTNRISVDAVDKAGNVMHLVRTVVLDSIPPVLRIESPLASGDVADRMLDVRGALDDPTVTNVVVNGLLVPVVDLRFHKPFRLEEGPNVIVVEAWDRAMNYASRTFNIQLDTRPPALDVSEPAGDIVTRTGTLQMRGHVEVGAAFAITGSPRPLDMDLLIRLQDTFRIPEYTLAPGINTITFEATDRVGNVARIVRTVNYDLVPPQLILESLPLSTYNQIIDVSGVLLNGTSVEVDRVPVVVGPDGAFTQSVHLRTGLNPITVRAVDDAGNEQAMQVNVTRLKVPEPPKGILGAGPAVSLALVVVMFVIGLAVLYPAIRAREEAEAPPVIRPLTPLPPAMGAASAQPRPPTTRRRPRRGAPPPPPPPPSPPPQQGAPPQTPPWG